MKHSIFNWVSSFLHDCEKRSHATRKKIGTFFNSDSFAKFVSIRNYERQITIMSGEYKKIKF